MQLDEASARNEKFTKMTTAPVEKLVLELAAPSIVIMLISALYNMADTYFVSSLGTTEVGAIGVAFPIMTIIQAIGFFFGQGSGNYMARALGAQKTDDASRMAATGFITGFLAMAIIATAGIIGLESLVDGLGATQTIRPFAKDYLFFILLASPLMAAAMVLNLQLRYQGSSAIAMKGILLGGILNIFLDPLFIFVFHMGVTGAAVATMISQLVSLLVLLCYGCTREGNIPIMLKHFSPSILRYIDMFKGGLPNLFRQGLMSVTAIMINHFARPYGDAAIAAISIANRISMLVTSIILGFGQGFQPVCGFNYGAKLYNRVKKSFWFCVRFGCCALFIGAIITAIFAPQIIALFRKDDLDVITIGAWGLRLQCISLPFTAFIIMINMITQSMGIAFESSVVAFSSSGALLVPCLFILGPILGLTGIQAAKPVSDIACLFIVIPVLIKTLKMLHTKPLPESAA